MRILFLLATNLVRLALAPLWWLGRRLSRPRAPWLHVRLRPRVVELLPPIPWIARWIPGFAQGLPTPLSALRELAVRAGADPEVLGVVFEVPPLDAGWAACEALREVIGTLRARGKRVVVYLPNGGSHREAFVAAAADRVLVGPQATIALLGLSAESQYLKPLLDKLGVELEVSARAEYKTAAETLSRDSMSEPQREQITALLATVDRHLRAALAQRVGLEHVDALFERGLLTGRAAVESGFADDTCFEDELRNKLVPGAPPPKLVRAGAWLGWHTARLFVRVLRRPYIAVIPVRGTISDQTAPGLVNQLRLARLDPRAVGVVLQVSSPGGSASTSDRLHREVVRLAERKPVVAWFADVAASGGYYVAAPAHAIVSTALTMTGSIGVISARPLARKLLDKLGVRTEVIRMAPHAGMFSPARPLEEGDRAILEREIDAFYRSFVQIVADGRKRTFEEIEPLARGRVWSGEDAHQRGLVDAIGGFPRAVEEVKARLPPLLRAIAEPAMLRVMPFAELPPAEPPAARVLAALGAELAPETMGLALLLTGGERVLAVAPGLPVIA